MRRMKDWVILVVLLVAIVVALIIWYRWASHGLDLNGSKIGGYIFAFVIALAPTCFIIDGQGLKMQPRIYWIPATIVLSVILFFGINSDIYEARQKAAEAKQHSTDEDLEKATHEQEVATRDKQISDLKLQLANQERGQNQLIEKARQAERKIEQNHNEDRQRAMDQRDLIVKGEIASVQRSVRSLHEVQNGFKQTARGLNETSLQINRSANRIDKVAVAYQVVLPLSHPDMKEYLSRLVEASIEMPLVAAGAHLPGEPNKDLVGLKEIKGEIRIMNGKAYSTRRIEITTESPLYPSKFDPSFAELLSYPIRVRFKSRKNRAGGGAESSQSDLTLETSNGIAPSVNYYPGNGTMTLIYPPVACAIGKTTGEIWSTPDLENASCAVVRNTWDYATTEFNNTPLSSLQKDCRVCSINFTINDKSFLFNEDDMSFQQSGTLGTYSTFPFRMKSASKTISDLFQGR